MATDINTLTNLERSKLGYSNIPGPYSTATGLINPTVPITLPLGAMSATPLSVPPVIPPTTGSAGVGFMEGLNTSVQNQQQAELKMAQDKQEDTGNEITSLIQELGNEGAAKNKLDEQLGVNSARKQVDELTSQLESEQLAVRRAVESAKKNFQGTTAGLQNEVNRLESDSFQKQADIAIVQSAALRRYDTMSAIADRVLQAKIAPMKARLEALKFIYTENKQSLDKKDERLYKEKITAEEREFKKVEQREKTISDIKLEAAKNGADVATLEKMSKATTLDEALIAAGKFGGDFLKAELLKEQIKTEQAQRAKINQSMQTGDDELLSIDEATKLGVPYGTTKGQAISSALGSVGKPAPLNAVQQNALTSAKSLLEKLNTNFGGLKTTAPIGLGKIGFSLPGTARKDFIIQFENLKSLLSLDNVKLLKGQGAVSDAERQLLSDASTRLNRSSSPEEFRKTLTEIITVFNKASPEYQFIDSIEGAIESSQNSGLTPSQYVNGLY